MSSLLCVYMLFMLLVINGISPLLCVYAVHVVGISRVAKIWDYQNKTCVQTLEGHAQNVTAVAFHPELPIILTGSEDGTVKIWHSSTYRLETTLNYGLERVWSIAHMRGSNDIGIGYDEGSVMIKVSLRVLSAWIVFCFLVNTVCK